MIDLVHEKAFLAEGVARTKPQNSGLADVLARLGIRGVAGALALRSEMRKKTLSGEEVDPAGGLYSVRPAFWKNQKIRRSTGKEMKSSIYPHCSNSVLSFASCSFLQMYI